MKHIQELTAKIAEARAQHHANAEAMTSRQASASGSYIVAMQKELSAAISKGARPCPFCKSPPLGMGHPTRHGGVEYEIGCIACPPFKHTDGTIRVCRVRGGTLPRHAVEAWNEGPSMWLKRVG